MHQAAPTFVVLNDQTGLGYMFSPGGRWKKAKNPGAKGNKIE